MQPYLHYYLDQQFNQPSHHKAKSQAKCLKNCAQQLLSCYLLCKLPDGAIFCACQGAHLLAKILACVIICGKLSLKCILSTIETCTEVNLAQGPASGTRRQFGRSKAACWLQEWRGMPVFQTLQSHSPGQTLMQPDHEVYGVVFSV